MGLKEFEETDGNSQLLKNYNEAKETNDLAATGMVDFVAASDQKYGFDAYSDIKKSIEARYPSLANGYRPAFKSVSSYGLDKVGVDVSPAVTFRDEMGVPSAVVGDGVALRGAQDGSVSTLYAYRSENDSTETVVGKLNVLSFDNEAKQVHIISVNNAALPSPLELQQTLNDVYRQAVTTWTVVQEDPVFVDFPGGVMTHGGSGGIQTYNADQNAIVDAFVTNDRQLQRGDLYLFFVKDVTFKDRSLSGYMPLQRQIGFIYGNPTLKVVAHELGHGAFNLRHTFSPQALIAPEGKTQNLMDYAGGAELWKYQWDLIHDPKNMLFAWAQDEEEGAMIRGGDKQWVLHIYSPNISEEFMEAYNSGDIYEQRRLTFYALMHNFPDDFASRKLYSWDDEIENSRNKSAALFYNPKGAKGVTVYTFGYKDGAIKMDKKTNFEPDTQIGFLLAGYEGDKDYPVDVKLYNASKGGWDGSEYYGDNDFIGKDYNSSYTFGIGGTKDAVGIFSIFGKGSGIILGYMRGYGLVAYKTELTVTTGLSIGVGSLILKGKFVPERNEYFYNGDYYGPDTFSGVGGDFSGGVSILSGSLWRGYNETGDVIWEGNEAGAALGYSKLSPSIGVTLNLTNTKLLWPLKN